jgi:UDP-galactopyranose mutase
MNDKIIIIGAGPAGIGAAYHLDRDYSIYEAANSIGGLMRSKNINGFIFDYAGHIFFTKDNYIHKLINKLLADNFHTQNRSSWIFSHDTFTRYPFQSNTYGLPPHIIKDCIIGIVEARLNDNKIKPENFKEYIYKVFGKGIAEHFMIPYNEKIWTIPLSEMDCGWFEERVPDVSIEDVVTGALMPYEKRMGQNATFGYPIQGGCESIPRAFEKHIKNINTNSKVTAINLKDKYIIINHTTRVAYNRLISTIPLPEFFKVLIDDLPEQIHSALGKLRFNSVLCENIGIDREKATDKHWIYFHEEDFIFQRIFVQSNASPHVTPQGCSSFTAEITYSSRKPVDKKTSMERTIEGLTKADLIHKDDRILVKDTIDLEYGYVIYDHNRKDAIKIIRDYLDKFGIILAGRYAEWEYYNMDTALLAGKKAAELITRSKV